MYPSGFVFYGIWNIVKWFLDPVTQGKVQPMLALSGVQQYINDEHIPRDLVSCFIRSGENFLINVWTGR